MNVLLIIVVLFLAAGCSTTSDGKRHAGWVLEEKRGCVEKVAFRKKGLVYKNCF